MEKKLETTVPLHLEARGYVKRVGLTSLHAIY